jgi:hypothetical protein
VAGRFDLHSNDVSIYSCALGRLFAGQPPNLSVKPEYVLDFGWLEPYLQDPASAVATLMLCTTMLNGLGKDNPYWERQRVAYRDQWERIHEKTLRKVEGAAREVRLLDFFAQDGLEFMENTPEDAAVASFPPFYAGGYETMFKGVSEVLAWDEPKYPMMDQARLHQFLDVMKKRRYWLFGTDHRLESMDDYLRGIVQATARNVPVFMYASEGATRVSMPKQKLEPVLVPHVGAEPLSGKVRLAKLSPGQFNALRSQFLNPNIEPANVTLPLAVLINGKLAGAFAFGQPSTIGLADTYLLSDFPVTNTPHKRLSKLIVMAVLSHEARALMERYSSRRFRTVATTAFSNRPVSMKYRGVLDLHARKELTDSDWKYQLNYTSVLGRWSLQEALDTWNDRFGMVEAVAA